MTGGFWAFFSFFAGGGMVRSLWRRNDRSNESEDGTGDTIPGKRSPLGLIGGFCTLCARDGIVEQA